MKKIVVIRLDSIINGGDSILGDTNEYLIPSKDNCEIKRMEFFPTGRNFRRTFFIEFIISHLFIRLSRHFSGERRFKLLNAAYKLRYNRYYKTELKEAEYIIYSIGMLKYSTQDFSYIFDSVNRIAEKNGASVLMSAMSIEKPDINDWRYHQLVKACNYQSVKMITTRDGEEGLNRLTKYYIKSKHIKTAIVGDPALWIPECYGIRKNESKHVPIKLGIGLIRPDIFEKYRSGATQEQLIDVYKNLIQRIQNDKRFEYTLFCNGMACDYNFGISLLKELNLPSSKLLPAPKSGKELALLISQFDLVFGARLHSCITSVSLGIPVAGLLWDNKLDFFAETMDIKPLFTGARELDSELVLEKLIKAYTYKVNRSLIDKYKTKTSNSISEFLCG